MIREKKLTDYKRKKMKNEAWRMEQNEDRKARKFLSNSKYEETEASKPLFMHKKQPIERSSFGHVVWSNNYSRRLLYSRSFLEQFNRPNIKSQSSTW